MALRNFYPLDKDIERRRALAKVYALLIKLAEETENVHSDKNQEKEEVSVPLKNNIPPGQ